MKTKTYAPELIQEVIGLAWADEISFDEIKKKLGLAEADVITVMRSNLKPGSFRAWRKRVTGRKAKHLKMMRPKNDPIEEDDVAI
jgi:uncharacterized protein (TIGR03643 family)